MTIRLERHGAQPLQEQLVDQLRYSIATARYGLGTKLPSTRSLAAELDISFHTVRKAYRQLASEGLLEAVPGSGYRVIEREARPKSDRMEHGAAVIQTAVRKLYALGLDDSEMEYLFQEQIDLVGPDRDRPRVLFVAEFVEMANRCAALMTRRLQQPVDPVALPTLSGHGDAEYVIAPFPIVRSVMAQLPRADVIGVHTFLSPEALGATSRLYEHETLLLTVRYSDAIGPLSRMLRAETGFNGQVIATALEEGDHRLGALVRQCSLLLHTPATARRVRPLLGSATAHFEVEPLVDRRSADRVRAVIPA